MAFVVKTFFVQSFFIPSGSMEPILIKDDRLLVQKISYWMAEPKRGDIVVFDDPGSWLSEAEVKANETAVQRALTLIGLFPEGGHLIKRVIGVAGDTVECCDAEGRILVNGEPLDEPYLKDPAATDSMKFSITVPEGRLWVMGDNRANSADSRAHMELPGEGTVRADSVVGKAWLRLWPSNRFGIIENQPPAQP